MMKRVGVALAMLAGLASAQEPTQDDFAAASAMGKAVRQGQYLAADTMIRARAFDADGTPKPGFIYDQWAELQGLLTGEPGPRIVPRRNDPEPGEIAALGSAVAQDAIGAIVARARKTRLVILNEDHASPRDRAFGLQVARALRPLGYDVLGIETLTNVADDTVSAAAMATLARERYPHRVTGTYLRDPVFADFLRRSLALGYRPIAYEETSNDFSGGVDDRIARREQAQADYVVRRALNAYPKSKVLLYVGFSHATENADKTATGQPRRWLATRLKAMTGIDPLTIDQTILNDYGAGQSALHALVADRVGARPAILFAHGKPLVVGQYAGLIDLQVAHPRTMRVGGRPDWLVAMGRTPTPIPADLLPKTGKRLIQAFIAGETEAIPVDQVLVTAGGPTPSLMLPKAAIRYAVQDPTG